MNTIAYNGEDGVAIEGTAPANTLVRNLIFVNGTSTDDVGIDLDADGVTANDGDDVDSGPNDLLNHPLITAVDTAAGTVGWTLDGLESTNYRLEFYASRSATAPGAARASTTSATSTSTRTPRAGCAARRRPRRPRPRATTSR
jgi:hypothetical protein